MMTHNMLGNEAATFVKAHKDAGTYWVPLQGALLRLGQYTYQLRSASFVASQQLVLIKYA